MITTDGKSKNLMADTIINHPYLVYKDYTEMVSKINHNLVATLPTVQLLSNQEIETLSILEAQIKYERSKEKQFIEKVERYLVEQNLTHLYDAKNYSQIITLFDAYQKGIVQDCNTFQDVIKRIEQFYKNVSFTSSKQFILDFFDKKSNNLLNKNIDAVFDELKKYVDEQYQDPILRKTFKEAVSLLSKSYFKSSRALEHNYIFTEKDLITTSVHKSNNDKSIMESLRSILWGTFSGLPGEVIVGGAWTGQQIKSKTKKNPDTDIVTLYDNQITMRLTEQENLLAMQESYEKMVEIAQQFTNSYRIHYSVKSGSGSTLKIKEPGSYLYRLEELKNLFQQLGINNYRDFLFTLANTIPGMAAENMWPEVRKSLLQLTTIFMFDDIIPSIVENQSTDNDNENKLNFYNIRGKIIVASDLFQLLYDSIYSEVKSPTIISLDRKAAPIDYIATTNGLTDTVDKWDAVYITGMTQNKINYIRLNAKNLIEGALLNTVKIP